MLVLSMKQGHRIVIAQGTPHETIVRFVKDKGHEGIQLGFEADRSVRIMRGTLLDRERTAADRIGEVAERMDLGGEG